MLQTRAARESALGARNPRAHRRGGQGGTTGQTSSGYTAGYWNSADFRTGANASLGRAGPPRDVDFLRGDMHVAKALLRKLTKLT